MDHAAGASCLLQGLDTVRDIGLGEGETVKTVVSLFDLTGNAVQPWLDAGYECWIVDIQHPEGITREGNLVKVGADLMDGVPDFVPHDPVFTYCWPDCTDVSLSGAAWYKGKGLRRLANAINMFATAADYSEATGNPYLIENPMSMISTYWRTPDHKFHPCQYSGYHIDDNYTKETWLWTGGGFVMPPKSMPLDLEIDTKYIHHQPPGPERANIRSATPMGFAKAVFEANRPHD